MSNKDELKSKIAEMKKQVLIQEYDLQIIELNEKIRECKEAKERLINGENKKIKE